MKNKLVTLMAALSLVSISAFAQQPVGVKSDAGGGHAGKFITVPLETEDTDGFHYKGQPDPELRWVTQKGQAVIELTMAGTGHADIDALFERAYIPAIGFIASHDEITYGNTVCAKRVKVLGVGLTWKAVKTGNSINCPLSFDNAYAPTALAFKANAAGTVSTRTDGSPEYVAVGPVTRYLVVTVSVKQQ